MAEHEVLTTASGEAEQAKSEIIELRQYTLLPGKRDILIDLFERYFIDEQERLGMEVIDHFRDLDDPDRFVWLRGFRDMPARATATTAFYEGAVWWAHRDAANATMIDTDDVLLLHPASPASGYPMNGDRPPVGATADGPSCLVVATIVHLVPDSEDEFPAFFASQVEPALRENGARLLAASATEHSPNNYPRLPIREGEHVFVWLSRFAEPEAFERYRASLDQSPRWQDEVMPELARRTVGTPDVLRLIPTARSRLRS